MQLPVAARLVDEVNGLVRQETFMDMFSCHGNGIGEDVIGIADPVKVLVKGLQSLKNPDGFLFRGFQDFHILEAADQGLVLFEIAFVFLKGGGADKPDMSLGEIGFEQVGGVHGSLAGCAGTGQCVNLINVDDGLFLFGDFGKDALEAFFEFAAVLGSGQHAGQIQHKYPAAFQGIRNIPAAQPADEAVGDGRLSDTGLADVQRIVFVLPAQDLHGPVQFHFAPDQRFAVDERVIQAGSQQGQIIGRPGICLRCGGFLSRRQRLIGLKACQGLQEIHHFHALNEEVIGGIALRELVNGIDDMAQGNLIL